MKSSGLGAVATQRKVFALGLFFTALQNFRESNQRVYGYTMAALTSLLWGGLPILLKIASAKFSPIFIVWCRFIFAFLALLAVMGWRGQRPFDYLRKPPILGLVAGFFLTANYYSYMLGVRYSGASNAVVLIQTGGLMLVAIGVLFHKEALSARQVAGFALACLGLYMFCADRGDLSLDPGGHYFGSICTLIAGAAWAIYATCLKGVPKHLNPQLTNLLVFGLGGLVYSLFMRWDEFYYMTPGYFGLMILLGLNTVLAYAALVEALRSIPSAEAVIIMSTNPLITLALMSALGWLAVGWLPPEPVSAKGILGAVVTIAGVILVTSRR